LISGYLIGGNLRGEKENGWITKNSYLDSSGFLGILLNADCSE
jgi:hypothetical protein